MLHDVYEIVKQIVEWCSQSTKGDIYKQDP